MWYEERERESLQKKKRASRMCTEAKKPPCRLEQRRPKFHHCSSFHVAPLSGLTRSRTSNEEVNSTFVELTSSEQQPTWGAFSTTTRKN